MITGADVRWCRGIGRSVAYSKGLGHYADDCEGAALEALVIAEQRWDGSGSLRGWASRGVRGASLRHLRSLTGWRRSSGPMTVVCEQQDIAVPAPGAEVLDELRQLRESEDGMKEREMSETMRRLARVDALDAEVTALGEQYTAKRSELAEAERELLADARIAAIMSRHAAVKKAKPASAGGKARSASYHGEATIATRLEGYLAEHQGEEVAAVDVAKELGVNIGTVRPYFSQWSRAGILVESLNATRPGWWRVLAPRAA